MIEAINTNWPLTPQDTLSALVVFSIIMLLYIVVSDW